MLVVVQEPVLCVLMYTIFVSLEHYQEKITSHFGSYQSVNLWMDTKNTGEEV